jgi:hypothetical protein
MESTMTQRQSAARGMTQRTASLRTKLVLLSVATFFGSIIVALHFGASTSGIGVLRFAIIGFLSVAIGRDVPK